MWKSRNYTFPNPEEPVRLDMVGELGRSIRGIVALNNTPYFLYIGTQPRSGREDALMVVEPYSDVSLPVDVRAEVFVTHGPAIGIIPGLTQATVQWTDESVPLAVRKYGRNVVIPIISREVSGQVSSGLTAQTGGQVTEDPASGSTSASSGLFAVPASARRRSLYRKAGEPASVTGCKLQGSHNGILWIDLMDVPEGLTELDSALALPPYLRLDITTSAATQLDVYMVVDL